MNWWMVFTEVLREPLYYKIFGMIVALICGLLACQRLSTTEGKKHSNIFLWGLVAIGLLTAVATPMRSEKVVKPIIYSPDEVAKNAENLKIALENLKYCTAHKQWAEARKNLEYAKDRIHGLNADPSTILALEVAIQKCENEIALGAESNPESLP